MAYSHDEISKLVDSMEKQVNDIKHSALKMCWYMRGGLNYDQAMLLSTSEREEINKIIEENLETTKKSRMPFF